MKTIETIANMIQEVHKISLSDDEWQQLQAKLTKIKIPAENINPNTLQAALTNATQEMITIFRSITSLDDKFGARLTRIESSFILATTPEKGDDWQKKLIKNRRVFVEFKKNPRKPFNPTGSSQPNRTMNSDERPSHDEN